VARLPPRLRSLLRETPVTSFGGALPLERLALPHGAATILTLSLSATDLLELAIEKGRGEDCPLGCEKEEEKGLGSPESMFSRPLAGDFPGEKVSQR
jgi:hypothetical protein